MDDKLGLAEYTEVLYDSVGTVIIGEWYTSGLDDDEDIIRTVVYNMWNSYYRSDLEVSIRRDAEILQSFLILSIKNIKV